MRIRTLLYIINSFIYIPFGFCQTNAFNPGFYIRQNGDSIKGFIQFKSNGPSTTFSYRKALTDAHSDTVDLGACKKLVAGTATFITWNGTMRMTYIDKFDLAIKNPDQFKTSVFVLELVYEGSPLSLYTYRDQFDHYLVQRGDSITELYSTYRYLSEWEKSTYIGNPPPMPLTPSTRMK